MIFMSRLELVRALIHLHTKYEFKHRPNRDVNVFWYIDDEEDLIVNYTEEKHDELGELNIDGLCRSFYNAGYVKIIDFHNEDYTFNQFNEITPLVINMCILIMKDEQITSS